MSWTLTILGVPLGHWTIRPSGTHDRYIITHFHIQKIIAWRELVAHLIKARNQLPDDKFKPGIESGQKFSQKKKTWACLVSQEQCLSFLCQSYAVIIIFQPAHSQSFSFASQVDNSPQSGFFVERFPWVLLAKSRRSRSRGNERLLAALGTRQHEISPWGTGHHYNVFSVVLLWYSWKKFTFF